MDPADNAIDEAFTEIFEAPTSWIALADVEKERERQDEKWGQQNHPDGTDGSYVSQANTYRRLCEQADLWGGLTWRHILLEEVHEALAETDADKLRTELVQVAAVAVSWIEALDRRTA